MSATIIFNKKKKTDEIGYVSILYVEGEKRKKVSLDFSLTKDHFTKYFNKQKKRFKTNTYFDKDLINQKIDDNIDIDVFKSQKKSTYKFLEYLETRKELHPNQSTKKTYNSASASFSEFLKTMQKKDIDFIEIDDDFITRLKNFLIQKGLESSSVRLYFNIYATVINKAKILNFTNPFDNHLITVDKKPKKILDDDDIKTLLRINRGQRYFIESRMFLFSFFANGLRCSDMMMMKNENIKQNNFDYIQMKTKSTITLKYNTQLLYILLEIYGLDDYYEQSKANWKHTGKLDLSYNDCLSKVNNNVSQAGYYDDEEYNYITWRGRTVQKDDEETKQLINHLHEIRKDIDVNVRIKLFKHIASLNPKEVMFKDFIESSVFDDYDKNKVFTEEQFKIYKRKLASYNTKLKRMAKIYDLSIKNISTHTARFTFTNVLLDMDEINLNDIRISLGHSNLTTTQKYIQNGFDFKKSDVLNEKLNNLFS